MDWLVDCPVSVASRGQDLKDLTLFPERFDAETGDRVVEIAILLKLKFKLAKFLKAREDGSLRLGYDFRTRT